MKIAQIANTLSDQVAAFIADAREAFNAPRRGRKSDKSFEEAVQGVKLPACVQRLFDANPAVGYVALATLRRDLSANEAFQVAQSTEAAGQGLLPCGDPAQKDMFAQTPIRVVADDTEGAAFLLEGDRAILAARAWTQIDGSVYYVRYQPNVVLRKFKGVAAKDEKHPWETGLRARYGGRFYVSDVAEHSGTLIAVITPNEGTRTALGRVELQVPWPSKRATKEG